MAVRNRTGGDTTAFADIVCADPDWVVAEFEQIVAYLVTVPTSTEAPVPPSGERRLSLRNVHPQDRGSWLQELPERVRAPPSLAAAAATPSTITQTV